MKNTVTIKDVRANMKDVIKETRVEFGKPVSYVTVKMLNGFTLRESTTCVDPENYNEEIGFQICMDRIQDKIWYLLGYQLQEDLYRKQKEVLSTEQMFIRSSVDARTIFDASKIVVMPYNKTLAELIEE